MLSDIMVMIFFPPIKLLLQAEDDGDARAASHAKAEQLAEMAEFDETFSADSTNTKVINTRIFGYHVLLCVLRWFMKMRRPLKQCQSFLQ